MATVSSFAQSQHIPASFSQGHGIHTATEDVSGGLAPGVHHTVVPHISLSGFFQDYLTAKNLPAGYLVDMSLPGFIFTFAGLPTGADLALAHPDVPIGGGFQVFLTTTSNAGTSILDSADATTIVSGPAGIFSLGLTILSFRRQVDDYYFPGAGPCWECHCA
jgi:hypothetical protein